MIYFMSFIDNIAWIFWILAFLSFLITSVVVSLAIKEDLDEQTAETYLKYVLTILLFSVMVINRPSTEDLLKMEIKLNTSKLECQTKENVNDQIPVMLRFTCANGLCR